MIVESNQHLDDVAQKLKFYLAELHLWCRKTETSSYSFIEILGFWQNWEIMSVTHAIHPSGLSSAELFKSLWKSPTHQVVDMGHVSRDMVTLDVSSDQLLLEGHISRSRSFLL